MRGYVLSPRARSDLDEIWDYSVREWSVDQAESYLRDIERALGLLAEHPRMGRSCDDIRAGYFKQTAGSHVLFYKIKRTNIDVKRILHQRMDPRRHL